MKAAREEEGKRREKEREGGGVQIAETFGAQKRAHAQWEGGGYGVYAAAPTKPVLERTEQDGPRENVVSDGGREEGDGWVGGWMDGRTPGKRARICLPFFDEERQLGSYRFGVPVVIRVLTLVVTPRFAELFGVKFWNLSAREIFPRDARSISEMHGDRCQSNRQKLRLKFTRF